MVKSAWVAVERGTEWAVINPEDGEVIATVADEANARIIAQAPALLFACKNMFAIVERQADDSTIEWIHEAIINAEGR